MSLFLQRHQFVSNRWKLGKTQNSLQGLPSELFSFAGTVTEMEHALQQDRLGQVSAMAASLADRMLMERLSRGALPLENATALWTASLLLEEHEHPVPDIVSGVLSQFREVEPDQTADEADLEPVTPKRPAKSGRRTGMAIRLLRPLRALASA